MQILTPLQRLATCFFTLSMTATMLIRCPTEGPPPTYEYYMDDPEAYMVPTETSTPVIPTITPTTTPSPTPVSYAQVLTDCVLGKMIYDRPGDAGTSPLDITQLLVTYDKTNTTLNTQIWFATLPAELAVNRPGVIGTEYNISFYMDMDGNPNTGNPILGMTDAFGAEIIVSLSVDGSGNTVVMLPIQDLFSGKVFIGGEELGLKDIHFNVNLETKEVDFALFIKEMEQRINLEQKPSNTRFTASTLDANPAGEKQRDYICRGE